MAWDETVQELKTEMEGKHAAREAALKANRAIIQTCSKAIKQVHRRNFEEADRLIAEAKALATEARASAADHPEVLYAGYLQDAEKELVEACGCRAMATGQPLPTAQEIGVQAASYLNGMGECASEMRRTVLDLMREGKMEQAARILGEMETVYDDLTTFDFPDGLTGGLRRTCDALRAVIERTRSDVTMTKLQSDLIHELKSARHDVRGKGPE